MSLAEALDAPAGDTLRVRSEPELRGIARGSFRRSGRDGARTPELPDPPPLGRDTAEPLDPPDGLELVLPPELPPEPPDGRLTAEPLLPPLGFGRAPDWPFSCASTGRANAKAVAVKTDVKARRFITTPMVTQTGIKVKATDLPPAELNNLKEFQNLR